MKLDDLPRVAPDINLLPRQRLEEIALTLARAERDLRDLADRVTEQQAVLCELRSILIQILWPRDSGTQNG